MLQTQTGWGARAVLAGSVLALSMAIGVSTATAAETSAQQTDNQHTNACAEVNAYRMAVAYQRSAEVHALQLQAYNMGRRLLADILAHPRGLKQPAVVLDLDETVISNVPLFVQGLEQCFNYTNWGKHWSDWVDAAEAPLIPGAGAFLEYADEHGVKIFYVSNRVDENEDAVIKNLKKLGLPQVSEDSVMLLGPSKAARRQQIKQDYDIVLLFGDNLHDFSEKFDVDTRAQRNAAVARNANLFGSRYIVLPNSSYGAWAPAYGAWQQQNLED